MSHDEEIQEEYLCLSKEEYARMGVTPRELYYRQNGLCWLEIAYDRLEKDDLVPGDLYCTDGEEYARTADMLNPTVECSQCMSSYLLAREYGMYRQSKIDKFLYSLLITISKSKSVDETVPEFYMSRNTLDSLESYIDQATISSTETKPLKVTAGGTLLLFGLKVNYLSDLEDGHLMLQPGNFLLSLPDAQSPH